MILEIDWKKEGWFLHNDLFTAVVLSIAVFI